MKRFLLSLVALVVLSCSAQAATCTWSGGTGNWDNSNTASWSCGHVPTSSDTVVFDGTSGGGTITVCGASSANCPNGSGVVTIVSLTFGAFTGTLDFATNNPNVTITTLLSGTGTGTRTFSMGNGVWTWGGGTSPSWNFLTTTNLTLNINSSSIVWAAGSTSGTFFGGGQTWGALTINANTSNPAVMCRIEPNNPADNTFASLTVNAPAVIQVRSGRTQTFTGGITVSGSSFSNMVTFLSDGVATSAATIAVGATSNVAYTAWYAISGATNAINATNSIQLGFVSTAAPGTLSITAPSGGGGGKIIGG